MPRPALLRFFTEDLGTKVLALVLAFLLWVAVSFLGTRTVIVEEVSVGTVNLRDDLATAEPIPPVRVKIRAPRALLRKQEPKEFVRAFVDLAGRGLGAQSAEVNISPTDQRVDVVIVLPARISFLLEPVVRRSLPVTVVPDGAPAEGYETGEGTADPKTVTARGGLRRLQTVQAIEVRVPVQSATSAIEGEYPLIPPEGVSVLAETVRVKLEIRQSAETKTLGVRVVTAGTVAAGSWIRSVTTDPSVLTVKGPRGALADRSFLETVAVDVNNARAPLERETDVVLPSNVSIQGGSARIRVRIDVAPLEGSKEITAAVQVEGVPDGFRVSTVSPGTIRVTVRGSGEPFDRLRNEDVRIVLSASGRSAGTFTVRPEVSHVRAPSGIQVVSVEGVDVNVTLEGS